MAQPYVGEIRMFAGNFAPAGWAFCDGSIQPIIENETLFNLIGTTYGGDGQETFALPDLRGRIPIHQGTNPQTGTTYQISQMAGVESVTLATLQIPFHTHPLLASSDPALTLNAEGNVLGATATATPLFQNTPALALSPQSITPTGGSQPHDNMQPYICVNFIISLFGLFPTQ
jgi:microcystin-dependent protein